MKITIVYADKQKRIQRPEFSSEKQAFDFIYYNQPISIIAIRIDHK